MTPDYQRRRDAATIRSGRFCTRSSGRRRSRPAPPRTRSRTWPSACSPPARRPWRSSTADDRLRAVLDPRDAAPLGRRRRRRRASQTDRDAAGAGAADRHRARRVGDGRRPRDGRDGRRRARDHGRRRRRRTRFRRWSRRTISRACFGEQPTTILRDIRQAPERCRSCATLNQRARALTLEYLTSAAAVEWLARLTHLVDAAIVTRILALDGAGQPPGCWCFCGIVGSRRVADQAGASPRRHRRRTATTWRGPGRLPSRARRRSPSATTSRASCPSRRRSTWRGPASGRAAIAAGFAIRSCRRCVARGPCSTCVRCSGRQRCGRTVRPPSPTTSIATSSTCSPTTAWRACRR